MTRDEYVESIKSAFVTLGTKGVYGVLCVYVPFFKLPIIGWLTEAIIKKIISTVVDLGEMQAFFWYIDMRTSEQGAAFENAAKENRKAQESGTPEEKKRAEENLINTFRDFAKLNH